MNESEIKKKIGERLKIIRDTLKKSQKDIAIELGLNQSTISQIESGVNSPSFQILWHLMSVYQVSLDWLMTGHGTMRMQNKDLFSFIRKGDSIDNRYIELLETMKDPDVEELIFAKLVEAKIIVKLKEQPNKL